VGNIPLPNSSNERTTEERISQCLKPTGTAGGWGMRAHSVVNKRCEDHQEIKKGREMEVKTEVKMEVKRRQK
jgi:hypothetical protein